MNAGLLLVAASQAFFALMNVAVKKLNSLDPPVPALEVRRALPYFQDFLSVFYGRVRDSRC